MSAEKSLKMCVAIVKSFHEPRGYVPTVICNDCYSRQEGVGFKGQSVCQSNCVISVSVGSLQNFSFFY